MLGRCASCLHLHNATTRLVTCDLPVRDALLQRFQDKQRWAYPKHTGAIGLLRTEVVEERLALFVTGLDVKIIAHHQEDINSIWGGFCSDRAAKEHQTFQCAGGTSAIIDTL